MATTPPLGTTDGSGALNLIEELESILSKMLIDSLPSSPVPHNTEMAAHHIDFADLPGK